jgi:hypothetical protein
MLTIPTLLLLLGAFDLVVMRFGTDSREPGDWRANPVAGS